MSRDDTHVRRRRSLRGLRAPIGLAAPPPPSPPAAAASVAAVPVPRPRETEPSFVCTTCRREMLLSERSRISRAKCRACV
jgi:hypothetical protein